MTAVARIRQLAPSGIRRLAAGAPPDAVNLGLGEPGWPLPAVARRALAASAADDHPHGYGPNEGIPELVDAVATHHDTDPGSVMVTTGAQGALFALVQAHVGPGQRVLVPDPGFPAYRSLVSLAGGVAVPYPLDARGCLDATSFALALRAAAVQGHTDAGAVALAVVNVPGNPTGGGASRQALAEVAASAREHGVLLVSDEVYRELHLGPRQPSLHDVTTDGVVVSSVSKAWAAPGLRVGWGVGDPELLAPARLVHAAMVTAPARSGQQAAAALLRASDLVLEESWRELVTRWTIAQVGPAAVRPAATPAGGFYHWLAVPDSVVDLGAFCLRLRDEGRVTVVPGDVFGPGGARHVRVSCGGDPARLREGLRRLAPFWQES